MSKSWKEEREEALLLAVPQPTRFLCPFSLYLYTLRAHLPGGMG
jgi:hypothetical protein